MTTSNEVIGLTKETTFLLPGPAGELEILLSAAPSSPKKAIAIICHPHPLHGGTMQNKVVTTLAKTFQQLQMQTIRFNFRGVGKSTGTYAEGEGELEDLFAVLEWVKEEDPETAIWLAGFSFGAYIAIRAAAVKTVAGLVTIAPPVNHFPFEETPIISCPWIIVQGEADEVVPATEVLAWIETLDPKPIFVPFPGVGHFFHGSLMELRTALLQILAGHL